MILRNSSAALVAACATFAFAFTTDSDRALAQSVGCQGQTAGGTAQGAALTSRIQQETIEKAKASAGLAMKPMFGGVSASVSHLEHDGFDLERPVAQNGCAGAGPISKLEPFETTTYSVSGLAEVDLTRAMRMPSGYTLRAGIAVGYKSLETESNDILSVFTPSNLGPSRLEEDGVQIDYYTLVTQGSAYVVFASSIGFGDSEVSYRAVNNAIAVQSFRGSSNYTDYSSSAVVGNVFVLSNSANGRLLADLSGGVQYTDYRRDAFTVVGHGRYGTAKTKELAGKAELKLALQMPRSSGAVTPYVKGGVLYRFFYESTYSTFDLGPAAGGPVTQFFDLETDDVVGIAGAGLGFSMNGERVTGAVEATYKGSGDSDEVVGKAQVIIKLN